MAAAYFLVEGRVQGVFFRASTRAQAVSLGLRGWAKNLADGRVEVVAAGDPHALDALAQWLEDGPPSARVDAVVREDAPGLDVPGGFEIR
ncbi:acylphosphatase [Luteimonas aestuarii]|uniref:Acylphosphatase n=1 Tax=Luteimonas aestuarii TaxID=453837 RepID=A0A4R5TJG8_9GAMM|nr:acylphosphatase [Luteimonas aestuarii]TDK21759.1 acylphosphatase [Luteimonas aestuarii]